MGTTQIKKCKAPLSGYVDKEPTDEQSFKVTLLAIDTRCIPHRQKRYLKGEKRKHVAETLGCMPPSGFPQKEENMLMEYGEQEPPHLYSSDVLRKKKEGHVNQLEISGND